MMLVGQEPKTLVILARKPGKRTYTLVCFGAKKHYRVDGSCKHTEELLANVKPGVRVVVDGWGGKPPAPKK